MTNQVIETRLLWAIIAIIAAVDFVWLRLLDMSVGIDPLKATAFCAAPLVAFVYTKLRPDPRIAGLVTAGGQLVTFTAAAAVLSYLTVTSNFPVVDRQLAQVDAALNLDWPGFFEWVEARPAIKRTLIIAYFSCMTQIAILFLYLSASGRLERLREFIWLFVLTLLVIIPISWLLPAASAWVHFGVAERVDAYHLADFTALRAGEMRHILLAEVNGLITFPSFHAALAVILIYACRGLKILFFPSLALNSLMLAATPTVGGHHFIDIVAGIGVVACVITVHRLALSTRDGFASSPLLEPLR